jgi:hypothetical protein
MMKKPVTTKAPAAQVVKNIRRATRKLQSSGEKIRILLSSLRGEDSIAELCRKEGIAQTKAGHTFALDLLDLTGMPKQTFGGFFVVLLSRTKGNGYATEAGAP